MARSLVAGTGSLSLRAIVGGCVRSRFIRSVIASGSEQAGGDSRPRMAGLGICGFMVLATEAIIEGFIGMGKSYFVDRVANVGVSGKPAAFWI